MMFKALPADDPKRRQPDIAKASRILGWEPRLCSKTAFAKH